MNHPIAIWLKARPVVQRYLSQKSFGCWMRWHLDKRRWLQQWSLHYVPVPLWNSIDCISMTDVRRTLPAENAIHHSTAKHVTSNRILFPPTPNTCQSKMPVAELRISNSPILRKRFFSKLGLIFWSPMTPDLQVISIMTPLIKKLVLVCFVVWYRVTTNNWPTRKRLEEGANDKK